MKKILIIGAGFLQDFVICRAKAMGYEVYAVDADANAVGFLHADHCRAINIVDKEACLEYAVENKVDGVLTAATDYGVLTASYIAKKMGLPGLEYEPARLIKNKYKTRKCLCENKVDDTEQAYEIDENTDVEKLSKAFKYPIMVKPSDGSGSRGISRVDKAEDLKAACDFAIGSSLLRRAEIETFINGEEYGAESIVIDGKIYVLGIMKKCMTDPPFYAELGHAMPSGLNPDLELKIKKCIENAIETLGINFGSVNMDLLVTKECKVHIIDVGARMGGNMIGPCVIPYGTGIDYMAAMIKIAVGDNADLCKGESCAVATRLLAFKGGIVKNIPDIEETEKRFGVEIYHHLQVGMTVNEYHTNLDGCGYIVAKADCAEKAAEKAQSALDFFKQTIFEDIK